MGAAPGGPECPVLLPSETIRSPVTATSLTVQELRKHFLSPGTRTSRPSSINTKSPLPLAQTFHNLRTVKEPQTFCRIYNNLRTSSWWKERSGEFLSEKEIVINNKFWVRSLGRKFSKVRTSRYNTWCAQVLYRSAKIKDLNIYVRFVRDGWRDARKRDELLVLSEMVTLPTGSGGSGVNVSRDHYPLSNLREMSRGLIHTSKNAAQIGRHLTSSPFSVFRTSDVSDLAAVHTLLITVEDVFRDCHKPSGRTSSEIRTRLIYNLLALIRVSEDTPAYKCSSLF